MGANLSDANLTKVNLTYAYLADIKLSGANLKDANLSEADLNRTIFHPEHKKEMTLWYLLGMYAWHSRHHVAHITSLRERMKW